MVLLVGLIVGLVVFVGVCFLVVCGCSHRWSYCWFCCLCWGLFSCCLRLKLAMVLLLVLWLVALIWLVFVFLLFVVDVVDGVVDSLLVDLVVGIVSLFVVVI
jgi:hypothetical protein